MVKVATLLLLVSSLIYSFLTQGDYAFFTSFSTLLVPLLLGALWLFVGVVYATKLKLGALLNAFLVMVLTISLMLHHEVFTLGGMALLILPFISFLITLVVSLLIRIFYLKFKP